MIGKKYKHYMGAIYQVLHIALDTKTSNEVVVYQNVNDSRVFARELEEFNGIVISKGKPSPVNRFEEIRE
jgi:hypothetical protein